ncbi:cation-transporting ATPase [Microbacterium sp. PMB16]|uniref:cation-transporting ATPase n=1 Tax=Microbacterium sp. PMB16 TaxID=3120157 RepID=UPI003F4BB70D
MGKLSRLIGMATDAIEKNGNSSRGGQHTNDSRSTDWGGMLRGAVDAVRGPADPAAPAGRQQAEGRSSAPASADPYAPPPAAAGGAAPRVRSTPGAGRTRAGSDADRTAIARYDYLLQTAEPAQVEQIHRDAFARLTPHQRSLVEERMRHELAPGERPRSSSPDDLGRAAGRAEAMRPGRMRGLLSRVRGAGAGGAGGAAVMAGGAALGVLGAVAGGAVLSTVAAPLLEQAAGLGVDFTALAEGVDLESLASGVDVEGLTGGAEDILGSAGEAVSGLGENATGWGEKLGDLGLPGIGDLFGR